MVLKWKGFVVWCRLSLIDFVVLIVRFGLLMLNVVVVLWLFCENSLVVFGVCLIYCVVMLLIILFGRFCSRLMLLFLGVKDGLCVMFVCVVLLGRKLVGKFGVVLCSLICLMWLVIWVCVVLENLNLLKV